MKVRFKKKQFLRRSVLIVLLGIWYVPLIYSATKGESPAVIWKVVHWDRSTQTDLDRDLFDSPIIAYLESSTLYIRNDKPDGALNIAIVSEKSGAVVWEQVVPETATALVVIPLEGLPSGNYSLQLVNEWGGYLCGSFRKK